MKIIRKGNPKGLDIDYEVRVESPEDVEHVHNHLLRNGLLFLYGTGDTKYERITSNRIFHYISPDRKLYDVAFLFTEQEPKKPKDRRTRLDDAYDRAKNDPAFRRSLMKYMKLHKLFTALRKHMIAYGEPLTAPYIHLLNQSLDQAKIEHPTTYTLDSLKSLDRHILGILE